MDLRITIALLFILITGGLSLKCYVCPEVLNGVCDRTEICADGFIKCLTATVTTSQGSVTTKSCTKQDTCVTGTTVTALGTVSAMCCDTDLCNGADGVFKGSFLLLLCPLFIYALFH